MTAKTTPQAIKYVYVISGQSGRLRDAHLAKLRDFTLQGCDWSMCLGQFEAEKANIAEVLDELRTLPFLGPRRVVEIHRADSFVREHRQALEQYLASPSDTAVLVLLLDKPLPGNLRVTKLIQKIGSCCSIESSRPQDIPHMLVHLAKDTYGKNLAPAAAAALQELTGNSPNALAEEIEKLCLYIGIRPAITVEDVRALVGQNRELSAFEVTDALIQQDTSRAMALMERIFQQDRSAQFSIIGLLAWYVRRLRKARVMLDNKIPSHQICQQLKVWYRKDEFLRQVAQSSPDALRLACKQLTEADLAVKTSTASVPNAVEKFILAFTAKPQHSVSWQR